MGTILLMVLLTSTFVTLSGQKKQCPCSSNCYNDGKSTQDDNAYDTQQISCLGGYQCYVAQVKCAIAYCPPRVICESVCKGIKCPCNRTCELVRAEYPPDSGAYVIVPTCKNPCNPEVSDFRCNFNYYCQLQLAENGCARKGEQCTVKPVCRSECCKNGQEIDCRKGDEYNKRCYDKPLSCPIGPCNHTSECRVPCSTMKCQSHYRCIEDHRYTCAPNTCCPPPEEICMPWIK